MVKWTLRRAARLGFLAGRGASIETILNDRQLGAQRTAQSIKCVATRWHLPVKNGALTDDGAVLTVHVAPADREMLEQAAAARRARNRGKRKDRRSRGVYIGSLLSSGGKR
jgi:hypothetical protein